MSTSTAVSGLRFFSSGGDARTPSKVLARALNNEGITPRQFVRQVVLDANFDPEGSLVVYRDQTPVGYLLAIARRVPLENALPDNERGYITLFGVAPEARRQGVGTELLQRAEAFLASKGRKQVWISPYAPGYFMPGVDVAAYAEGLEFLKKRGYAEVYRPLAMQRSLQDLEEPPANRNPEIWYLGNFDRGRVLPTLQFVSEVFPGDWVRVVREGYREIIDGDRSDRIFVAMDVRQRRIVGFSHYREERFGPIGVHPDYRGKGIGAQLTYCTLQAQKAAGLNRAFFLWTDDRTADRLYKPAGFQEFRRFAVLKKEL